MCCPVALGMVDEGRQAAPSGPLWGPSRLRVLPVAWPASSCGPCTGGGSEMPLLCPGRPKKPVTAGRERTLSRRGDHNGVTSSQFPGARDDREEVFMTRMKYVVATFVLSNVVMAGCALDSGPVDPPPESIGVTRDALS